EPSPVPLDRCGRCLRSGRRALERARSLLWYAEEARNVLHKIKFGARFELLDVFREPFRDAFSFDGPREVQIIPVPLDGARLARRGFNQSERLGRWVAEALQVPLVTAALEKTRATPPQSTLSRREREKNLARCFRWCRKDTPPERVLLVDDVYTTGTTLEV